MPQILVGAGGFLCAILWVDLMFDVQAWGAAGTLAPAVLDSIAGYYRRVTTDAAPMGNVISLVMILAILGTVVQFARGGLPLWLRAGTVLTLLLPVVAALTVIVPAAVRLGSQSDEPAIQSELARTLLSGHLWCLASIAVFLVLELVAARRFNRATAPGV